jgi:hypothetical protein
MNETSLQPWRFPSLAFEYACDYGAQTLYSVRAGGLAIVASSAEYARHFLSRLDGAGAYPVRVYPSGAWYDPVQQPYFPTEAIQVDSVSRMGTGIAGLPRAAGIVWAEPTPADAAAWLRQIDALLTPDGVLGVVVGGRLAGRVPERGGAPMLGWRATQQLLVEGGFAVRTALGFHGVTSYVWAAVNVVLRRVPALAAQADRAEFAMRARFAFPATTNDVLSTLGWITAVRAQSRGR